MPPLLVPSPVLVDHTFPRNDQQLRMVAVALGELVASVDRDEAHLLLTVVLQDFLEEYDWNRQHDLVHEIYRLLAQLFLQPSVRTVKVDVSTVTQYTPHPVPKGTENEDLVVFWSDEVGKILSVHDQCSKGNAFFIGVASEYGFGGEPMNEYENPQNIRTFPLTGPEDLTTLDDAYGWEIPDDLHQKNVSFENAKKHVLALGALRVENPRRGGSHFVVRFEGARNWPLDRNEDPQKDAFLKQLIPITGYPFEVIKSTLLSGSLPDRYLKLSRVAACQVGE